MTQKPQKTTSKTWKQDLGRALDGVIREKGQVILCITGKSGSGKSTLGKLIRKKGLPGLPARKLAVIDDGVLAVPMLGFFTRRIKSKSREKDNLAPFAHYVRTKKVVVYVNSRPELRLEKCDVVLRLQLPEPVRQERLIHRDKDGAERFRKTLHSSDHVGIPADHVFDLCLTEAHDRTPQRATQPSFASVAALVNATPGLVGWMSCAAECC